MGAVNSNNEEAYRKGLMDALKAMTDALTVMIDIAHHNDLSYFDDTYDQYFDYACALESWAGSGDKDAELPPLPEYKAI